MHKDIVISNLTRLAMYWSKLLLLEYIIGDLAHIFKGEIQHLAKRHQNDRLLENWSKYKVIDGHNCAHQRSGQLD